MKKQWECQDQRRFHCCFLLSAKDCRPTVAINTVQQPCKKKLSTKPPLAVPFKTLSTSPNMNMLAAESFIRDDRLSLSPDWAGKALIS